MIFLKRLEAHGFKSFAEPLSLNFDHSMVGIVGPNGSGKSNINDAISWALGEQSIKSLRGSKSEDVIFNGSETKKPLNIAEVKLVFDNTKRFFNSPFDEIEISRKIYRNTKENEYFINKQRVRLKDVQEFALDTGLTKSSLSVISQGHISTFADSKPEEKRIFFEEAAGIGKSKKRKLEAMRKLEKVQENIERCEDIANEIQRRLPKLKKQYDKAVVYKEKKERLKKIELSILVQDIIFFMKKEKEIKSESKKLQNQKNDLNNNINFDEKNLKDLREKERNIERKISELSIKHQQLIELISDLKIQKMKRNVNSGEQASKVSIEDIKKQFEDSNYELAFHENRLEQLKKDLATINSKINEHDLLENEAKKNISNIDKLISRFEYMQQDLKNKIENNTYLFQGVKTIIQNKKMFKGIEGLVQDILSFEDNYSVAINTVLSKSQQQNIIIDNTDNVKICLEFLKKNRSGQVTFLPIDKLTASIINDNDLFLAKNIDGFLGLASDLVKVPNKFKVIKEYLLGRILVGKDYDSCLKISQVTNQRYNVVSLEGDLIKVHGAIQGGQNKKIAINNYDQDLEKVMKDLKLAYDKLESFNLEINELDYKKSLILNSKNEINSKIFLTEKNISKLKIDIQKIKTEYTIFSGQELIVSSDINNITPSSIVEKLANMNAEKDDLVSELEKYRSQKDSLLEKIVKLEDKIKENNSLSNSTINQIAKSNTDLGILENKLNLSMTRLASEYKMTFDYAKSLQLSKFDNEEKIREEIFSLRNDLSEIGDVSLYVIDEYLEDKERHEYIESEIQELKTSISNLLQVINELDLIMKNKLFDLVKNVNKVLPETFKILFGGGSSKIIFEDENNVLESGVIINVSPPGKKITNLTLLSGGEKSLVALSVLFAILKVNPLPMAILDEAEAPLDPANVERFARYIKEFSKVTQFLMVTHRLESMEYCDVLYGATMQQKGITKIVGIKMTEAESIVA
ncbi:AAA family ATPase [Spiroplasma endosymbiont of Amphibalanus improvisus]|uniref:AAA family ATPase n=1 Tax=Spiroplasma endosymbiont of Amphibalanus improvisus TaxID=3066327 RepID=UPI00313C8A80